MSEAKTARGSVIKGIIKGTAAGMAVSTALVALAALLLYKQVLPFESVNAVNAVSKTLSALAAAFIGAGSAGKNRFLRGAASAVCYIVLTELLFGLIGGELHFGAGNAADIGMCAAAGMVGGMLRSLAGSK